MKPSCIIKLLLFCFLAVLIGPLHAGKTDNIVPNSEHHLKAIMPNDTIIADDGVADDYFGGSVSLSGNRAMVGARGDNSLTGAVYVFEFNGTNWIQVDKLTADDEASGDEFGNSISLQGDRVLIGSPRDDDNAFNSGAVYLFEFDGMSCHGTRLLSCSLMALCLKSFLAQQSV